MNALDSILAVQGWIGMYLVQPLIIVLLGIFIAKIVEQVLLFIFSGLAMKRYSTTFAAYVVKWFFYIATVLYALQRVQLLSPLLQLMLFLFACVIGVSIVLSGRDFFVNLASHHAVKAKHQVGAKLKNRLCEGVVVAVHLSDTHVKTKEGDDVYIPNSTLATL